MNIASEREILIGRNPRIIKRNSIISVRLNLSFAVFRIYSYGSAFIDRTGIAVVRFIGRRTENRKIPLLLGIGTNQDFGFQGALAFFISALCAYGKSICFADFKSFQKALGLFARSKIFAAGIDIILIRFRNGGKDDQRRSVSLVCNSGDLRDRKGEHKGNCLFIRSERGFVFAVQNCFKGISA